MHHECTTTTQSHSFSILQPFLVEAQSGARNSNIRTTLRTLSPVAFKLSISSRSISTGTEAVRLTVLPPQRPAHLHDSYYEYLLLYSRQAIGSAAQRHYTPPYKRLPR